MQPNRVRRTRVSLALLGGLALLMLAVLGLGRPLAAGWVSHHFPNWNAPQAWVVQTRVDTDFFWSPANWASAPEAMGWRGLLLGMPLDVNRADERDWAALPGVGKRTATALIVARDEQGGFHEEEGLMEAAGIGPAKWEKLAPWVRCEVQLASKGLE